VAEGGGYRSDLTDVDVHESLTDKAAHGRMLAAHDGDQAGEEEGRPEKHEDPIHPHIRSRRPLTPSVVAIGVSFTALSPPPASAGTVPARRV
jgi:hypothetical protein